MRVLVVHNDYASEAPSGENDAVRDDIRMLRAAGVEVHTYLRTSDEVAAFSRLERLGLAYGPVYAPRAVREVGALVAEVQPDVLHLHNPFPLISPAVVRTAAGSGVPTVQTVHNFRHVCMKGTFFREGHPCRDCVGPLGPLPGILHACYRGSRAQSTAMAAGLIVHRRTWKTVAKFLAPSEFLADAVAGLGIPAERIVVRPGFVPDPGATPTGHGFLYVGRLSEEKGIEVLLAAWRMASLPDEVTLTIVGDGALASEVAKLASADPRVRFTGVLRGKDLHDAYRGAAVVVVPSVCLESFGRTAVEAMAHGRPVIASSLGALGSTVDAAVGWSTAPTSMGIADALRQAATDRAAVEVRGAAARTRYESKFTVARARDIALDVYREVARPPISGSAGR